MRIANQGLRKIDVEPEQFTLNCVEGAKLRRVKCTARQVACPESRELRANTIVLDDSKSGAMTYRGSCKEYLLTWDPTPALTFEFPYERR